MSPVQEYVHQRAEQNRRERQQANQLSPVLDEDQSRYTGDCNPQYDDHDSPRKPGT